MNDIKFRKGVGLDLGTNAIVKARLSVEDDVVTSWIRDAFLILEPTNKIIKNTMKRGLTKAGIKFLEKEDKFIILGDDALNQSVERGMTTRRPMAKGVMSPREADALPMFKVLVSNILGKPLVENELCVYSIPSSPIDEPFDSEFHSSMINAILSDLGFKGLPMNEAQAIIYSELDDQDYTGMAISCGAGMINLAICNAGDPVCVFATSKSGDYIDERTAVALGYDPADGNKNTITPSTVQLTKETCELDLDNIDSTDRIQMGLKTYYEALINYTVDNIVYQIKKLDTPPRFKEPIVVIVSGGTSKPKGFVNMFKQSFLSKEKDLPFNVKEVRPAKEPLDSVARGCLIAAQLEYPEE